MTSFWITTAILSLAVTVLLALALIRGRRDTGPAQAFDLKVYRDQLQEVERDLSRGVLAPEDADRIRAEVSRRLLQADAQSHAQADSTAQPRMMTLAISGAVALVLIGGTYGVYSRIGAPGYGDLGLADRISAADDARANRPGQAEAEAQVPPTVPSDAPPEYVQLVEQLRGAVAERPGDVQGFVLLARSEAALGNYQAAYKAQERILTLKGDAATAKDYADLADMMILSAGGYVSPEAERAIEAALARDPRNGVARYYGGLMMAQVGRPDAAFQLWERLLAEGPADAPWIPPIRAQIEEMAMRAGQVNFQMPPVTALPGPTQDDIDAAQEMTPEERQAFIASMVNRRLERLATEGGTPEEWSGLLVALGVQGNTDQARAIWLDAQEVFAGNAAALDTIRAAAVQAGVLQ